jgi:hypothetical protein
MTFRNLDHKLICKETNIKNFHRVSSRIGAYVLGIGEMSTLLFSENMLDEFRGLEELRTRTSLVLFSEKRKGI